MCENHTDLNQNAYGTISGVPPHDFVPVVCGTICFFFLIEFVNIVILKIVFLILENRKFENRIFGKWNLEKSKFKKSKLRKLKFWKSKLRKSILGLLTAEPNWQPGVLLDRHSLWSNDHHTHLHEITASCKSCSIKSQRRHRPLHPPLHRRHQCPSQ